MRATPAITLPVLLAAAACGSEHLEASTTHAAHIHRTPAIHRLAAANRGTSVRVSTASDRHPVSTNTAPMCMTGGLSLRLGRPGSAAGSHYQPIVFTNRTHATCTLTGYPGVSFVAPGTGRQVGTAATRNAQHAVIQIALSPGGSASALLQIVNRANYPSDHCNARGVSGFRVYPPGNTAAAYVPFRGGTHRACSSQVEQLAVDAVVAGVTG